MLPMLYKLPCPLSAVADAWNGSLALGLRSADIRMPSSALIALGAWERDQEAMGCASNTSTFDLGPLSLALAIEYSCSWRASLVSASGPRCLSSRLLPLRCH